MATGDPTCFDPKPCSKCGAETYTDPCPMCWGREPLLVDVSALELVADAQGEAKLICFSKERQEAMRAITDGRCEAKRWGAAKGEFTRLAFGDTPEEALRLADMAPLKMDLEKERLHRCYPHPKTRPEDVHAPETLEAIGTIQGALDSAIGKMIEAEVAKMDKRPREQVAPVSHGGGETIRLQQVNNGWLVTWFPSLLHKGGEWVFADAGSAAEHAHGLMLKAERGDE